MIRQSDGYSLQTHRVVRVAAVKHTLKLSRVKVFQHPGWLQPHAPPSGGSLDIKSHFKPLCMPRYVYFCWGGGKRAACVSLYFGLCNVVLLKPSRGRQLRHKTQQWDFSKSLLLRKFFRVVFLQFKLWCKNVCSSVVAQLINVQRHLLKHFFVLRMNITANCGIVVFFLTFPPGKLKTDTC